MREEVCRGLRKKGGSLTTRDAAEVMWGYEEEEVQ